MAVRKNAQGVARAMSRAYEEERKRKRQEACAHGWSFDQGRGRGVVCGECGKRVDQDEEPSLACACGTEVFAHEPDENGIVRCAGAR